MGGFDPNSVALPQRLANAQKIAGEKSALRQAIRSGDR
jgi:hypothetical protein